MSIGKDWRPLSGELVQKKTPMKSEASRGFAGVLDGLGFANDERTVTHEPKDADGAD